MKKRINDNIFLYQLMLKYKRPKLLQFYGDTWQTFRKPTWQILKDMLRFCSIVYDMNCLKLILKEQKIENRSEFTKTNIKLL